jgi:hypothetical protein
MAASPSKARVSASVVVLGCVLLLLAFAAIYVGVADPLRLWPYSR